jgi:hypothetical protein
MTDVSSLGNLIGSAAFSASERSAPTEPAAPAARRVPQPRPDGDVDIRLRNGRRVRARIAPAVARRDDLAAVASAASENDRKAAGALRRHRAAIANLRRSHAELTKKVEELERRASLLGLAPGLPSLEERVRDLQALSVKSQIQSAGNVLNSLQTAAYGDKGSLLTTNNLLLAGNQLFWTLLDPVLRATGAVNAGTATVIAAAAPIASLFAGEILVGNRQQARFLSGVTTFTAEGVAREILPVAEHLRSSFRARTDVPVTVSALDPVSVPFSLTGRVVDGVLEIAFFQVGRPAPSPSGLLLLASVPASAARSVRVAWTVDLGADVG